MVSLILPPIIIVVSLTLLVFFFSRRLPILEARVREKGENVVTDSLWSRIYHGVQHAFWHFLEKAIRRFKLGLLKGHNLFNTLSDSVRRQREVSKKNIATIRKEHAAKTDTVFSRFHLRQEKRAVDRLRQAEEETDVIEQVRRSFRSNTSGAEQSTGNIATEQEREFSETPYVRQRRKKVIQEPLETPVEEIPPKLSVSPVKPEATQKETKRPSRSQSRNTVREVQNVAEPRQKDQFEEILIERIVSNPRDVEAYERLGDYYLEHENYVDAKECYRQVLKLSPVNRLVKIKIRRLEKILGK